MSDTWLCITCTFANNGGACCTMCYEDRPGVWHNDIFTPDVPDEEVAEEREEPGAALDTTTNHVPAAALATTTNHVGFGCSPLAVMPTSAATPAPPDVADAPTGAPVAVAVAAAAETVPMVPVAPAAYPPSGPSIAQQASAAPNAPSGDVLSVALAALNVYVTQHGGAISTVGAAPGVPSVEAFYLSAGDDGYLFKEAFKSAGRLRYVLSQRPDGPLRYDGSGANPGQHRIRSRTPPPAPLPPSQPAAGPSGAAVGMSVPAYYCGMSGAIATAALAAATDGSNVAALQQALSTAQGVVGVDEAALIAAATRLSLLEAPTATASAAPLDVSDAPTPPLPPGWASAVDPASGRTFYYNATTNQTQWELPTIAPPAPVPVPVVAPAPTPAPTPAPAPAPPASSTSGGIPTTTAGASTTPSTKTFATSNFLSTYTQPQSAPHFLHQLEGAVHGLILAHAQRHGVPTAEANTFFITLRRNALTAALDTAGGTEELLQPSHLMFIAVRLWTSAATLGGREFCSILNEALRNDTAATISHVATITHALNAFCVTRRASGAPPVQWPTEHVTYRGTAMPRAHRAFFTAGTKYRAPMFVATSLDDDVPVDMFLMRLPPPTAEQTPPFQEPTLWRFHLDASLSAGQRCKHVNYLDRNDGSFDEPEHEYAHMQCAPSRACASSPPRPLAHSYWRT